MTGLDLLWTFLEVYRRGVAAAAGRLGLSPQEVGERLDRLEEELGQRLFLHGAAGTAPTAAAARLAARVGAPLDELRAALDPAAVGGPPAGTVRIGGPAELVALRVLPLLAPAAARGLRLRVSAAPGAGLLELLAAGEVDLVVSEVRPAGRELAATPVAREGPVLVGPPSLAATVEPGWLAEDPAAALAHLPLVGYAADLPGVREYWLREFGARPANPVAVTVPDLRAVLAAVAAGAGVSVLPRYVAAPALSAGLVERLHTPVAARPETLFLAVRGGALVYPPLAWVHERLRTRLSRGGGG
ncbi:MULTISPECIES: LysR family transcriptional regulator [unclassified Streptomyces]|uniref:LysR family transcriptional regulator n=1 Tax=unclassified Streptomyces TaxID=2593676 RepID=UPI0033DD4FE5